MVRAGNPDLTITSYIVDSSKSISVRSIKVEANLVKDARERLGERGTGVRFGRIRVWKLVTRSFKIECRILEEVNFLKSAHHSSVGALVCG